MQPQQAHQPAKVSVSSNFCCIALHRPLRALLSKPVYDSYRLRRRAAVISAEIRLISVIYGRCWWLPCVFLEVCGEGVHSRESKCAGDPWKSPLHCGILSGQHDHLLQ